MERINDTRVPELGGGPAFTEFLAAELIPWIRKEYNAGTDPHQTTISGGSLAGFASTYAALLHPETFGNVICQSGTLHGRRLFTRAKTLKSISRPTKIGSYSNS